MDRDHPALDGSIINRLPGGVRGRLLDVAKTSRTPAGGAILRARGRRLGLLLEGTARCYISAPPGRQLTIHYARPGSVIGAWDTSSESEPALAYQAITNCMVLEFDTATVIEIIRADPEVAAIFIEHLSERLIATYETLASSTFGTIRQRIARHLLELAEDDPEEDRLIASITQQLLADGIGRTREAVARALGELRRKELIHTHSRAIEIVDREGLAAEAGGLPRRRKGSRDPSATGAERLLDASQSAIIGVNRRRMISYSNPSAHELFGWSREDLHGAPLAMVMAKPLDGAGEVFGGASVDEPRARLQGTAGALVGRRKDGSELRIQVSWAQIEWLDSQMTFITVVDHSEVASGPQLPPVSIDRSGLNRV